MRITNIQGTGLPLKGNDIDTDRIVPARFLKHISFKGLGDKLFFDERHNNPNHPLNKYKGEILLVNKNFGCGSSREHAPQALKEFGIKAIIGESFAEIFASNCTSIGIPTVTIPGDSSSNLMMCVKDNPSSQITIDVATKTITHADVEISFTQSDTDHTAFTQGIWDSTTLLFKNKEEIINLAESLPYLGGFN